MTDTTLHLHTGFRVGPVDPRVFGGFLEHMGRAVYEGVYDPDSAHSDEHGFRTDVLDALRRLNMTAMRYPGGNFASGYHWQDGVGPRDQRPTVRELAWQSIETNAVGTDEYLQLCRMMDWTPMITVNLGTGTPEEARNWVEYCNCPVGTKYADMRAANGHPKPYGVKLWCLGNEMDGPWQLGHVPADQYAIRAQQAAKMMKDVDPSIELVAAGSCNPGMPTYVDWDWTVLSYLGEYADYISLHHYTQNPSGKPADILAVTNVIDKQIEDMAAVSRSVQGKLRNETRAALCFDEWNVWYKNRQMDGEGKAAPHLIEEVYNLEDALVVAGYLNSFIRHADVVKIANIAQIVNVIAPILTRGNEMLLQSSFYAFEMMAKRRDGVSLRVAVDGPEFVSEARGRVKVIDASAILGDGQLHVFAVNRGVDESSEVRVALADASITALSSGELLTGPDAKAANSFEEPDVVRSQPFDAVDVADDGAAFTMPPLSLAALTFDLA